MSYAIRNDGLGWRAINGPADVGSDETFSETQPATVVDKNTETLRKISDKEAEITPRRLREGALGSDNGWLNAKDAEIVALRKLLIK